MQFQKEVAIPWLFLGMRTMRRITFGSWSKEVFEMTKGIVKKLNAYKSGKGYFIGLEGQTEDYMFFGSLGKEIQIGTPIVFDIGRPSKDNRPTIKSIQSDTIEAFEARDEDRAKATPILRAHDNPKDSREAYWLNREKHDLEKDATITRLSCLSSAVDDCKRTNKDVIETAKRFETFAKEGI